MKDANEILGIVMKTIASIYKRPLMHGTSARETDTLLWHYHGLWVEIMNRDFEDFRSSVNSFHEPVHRCNLSFVDHYRQHMEGGATASESEVIDYVIRMWMRMDDIMGIDVPGN